MNRRAFVALLGVAPVVLASSQESWKITLTSQQEPGEPLVVSGTICAQDGKSPAAGLRIYVYQTDADGYYNRPVNDNRNPRIKGWMRTGADGRYEFRTIKPAPYPGNSIPAHIHVHLAGTNVPEHWVTDYWFAGDKFLKPDVIAANSRLGTFSAVLDPKKDSSGVLRATRDFRLDPALFARNRV